MNYLETYLNTVKSQGNEALADSIASTAGEIRPKLENFSFCTHEIGLLFGNVQSGKTSQMFGIICEAADKGFAIFLLLTTDNITLQQQTLDRVRSDLKGFCICGENDSKKFADNNLVEPAIIVLKKNSRMLKLWNNILSNTGFVKGNPLFIIDDEADAASLNTAVNQNKQSSINRYLSEIRRQSMSSIYLQVTGTPQALFLQTMKSGYHPMFTTYFKPGESYLGGNFFFPVNGRPDQISFLDKSNNSIEEMVLRHIVVSGHLIRSGKPVSNCLFHPGVRISSHKKMEAEVKQALENLKTASDLDKSVHDIYTQLSPQRNPLAAEKEIHQYVKETLSQQGYKVLEMNGKNNVESTEYSEGCNFIIGGNTLGRGVTFPALNTIYYTRTSKNPQADTMWQHNRMFGYDRDPGLVKVYMDEKLYKLFVDINSTNNSIISQIERGADNVQIFYPKGINPTRKNVLDNDAVFSIAGGTNYYPFDPDNKNVEKFDSMLQGFDESQSSYQVSLRLIKNLLDEIIPSPDFNKEGFDAIIDAILADKPGQQGRLVIRRGRKVSQGTGALLSSNDFALSSQFKNDTVLTLYEIDGKLGWKKNRLWVPNIKLPENILYYDILDLKKEKA